MKKNSKFKLPKSFLEKEKIIREILILLFSGETKVDNIVFKGGTCLSMIYDITKRFSEDIDLSYDSSIISTNKQVYKKYIEIKKICEFYANKKKYTCYEKGNKDNKYLEIKYTLENQEKNKLDNIIKPGFIKIEPQLKKRKRVEKNNWKKLTIDHKIYCQEIESIYSEKIALIFENLLLKKHDSIKWLFKNNNSRHLYDLYMITKNKNNIKPNIELIKERFFQDHIDKKTKLLKKKFGTNEEKYNIDVKLPKIKIGNRFYIKYDNYLKERMKIFNKEKNKIQNELEQIIYPIEENENLTNDILNITRIKMKIPLEIINKLLKNKI